MKLMVSDCYVQFRLFPLQICGINTREQSIMTIKYITLKISDVQNHCTWILLPCTITIQYPQYQCFMLCMCDVIAWLHCSVPLHSACVAQVWHSASCVSHTAQMLGFPSDASFSFNTSRSMEFEHGKRTGMVTTIAPRYLIEYGVVGTEID